MLLKRIRFHSKDTETAIVDNWLIEVLDTTIEGFRVLQRRKENRD